MARFETFDRDIRIATTGISEDAIARQLASFAKTELARVIQSGEGSPNFTRYVNGREGAPEESVEPGNGRMPGPIFYQFAWWSEIITDALRELVKRSPRKSGRYASSFVVLSDQRPVNGYGDLPGSAEVIIFNAQPYTRKIEVGAMTMNVPPRQFDATTAVLRRKYGSQGAFRIEHRFVNIKPGLHPLVPYILKGEYAGRRNAQLAAARVGTLPTGFRKLQRRKDQEPGQPISYPAVIVNMVRH